MNYTAASDEILFDSHPVLSIGMKDEYVTSIAVYKTIAKNVAALPAQHRCRLFHARQQYQHAFCPAPFPSTPVLVHATLRPLYVCLGCSTPRARLFMLLSAGGWTLLAPARSRFIRRM